MGINTGALYIIFIMLVLFGLAYIVTGPTPSQTPILTGPEVALTIKNTNKAQAMLQLYRFNGATITPPASSLCRKGGANNHPDALIAYTPAQATAVSSTGQITLWVSDTKPPHIALGEQVARSNGEVTIAGDLESKAPDGYRWEPQIYIFPKTVDQNGKAYFPHFVRGDFNNGTPGVSYNTDVIPPYALPKSSYTVEFKWNVADIGLTDGEYNVQFVAHDGHNGLGIKCIDLRVYTPPVSQNGNNRLPL